MPRDCSTATCAFFIFEAATIFMALVIFPMFLIALIRCLTASKRYHCVKLSSVGDLLPVPEQHAPA